MRSHDQDGDLLGDVIEEVQGQLRLRTDGFVLRAGLILMFHVVTPFEMATKKDTQPKRSAIGNVQTTGLRDLFALAWQLAGKLARDRRACQTESTISLYST
jgi:hypothetical protein